MSRYRTAAPKDEAIAVDGDAEFLGVNMRLDPSALPPGVCALARNKRFEDRRAKTRLGVLKLPWFNQVLTPASNDEITPFGVIYGVGVFNDPDDERWLLIAADGALYRAREQQLVESIPLPSGVTITESVEFIQCLSDCILLRGEDASPLKLSTVDLVEAISQSSNTISGASTFNPQDGTAQIPNAATGLFMANRLCVPYSRDLVAASDYLNYTRYAAIRAAFRINQGTADAITALVKFDESTIIVAKEESIYRVFNVTGNLSAAVLDEITRSYGCKARRTFAQVGRDLWFLAERRGVTSIQRTDQGKLQSVDIPVSDDMQPLINRIKWSAAVNACAAYWNNRYYLAVPIDSAEIIRDSIVPAGQAYSGGGSYTLTVKAGRTYRYSMGADDTGLTNGSDLIISDADFIAAASTVTMLGTTTATITASVQPVFKDVNNCVLIFNFLTGRWEGYDDGPAIMVQQFFKFPYAGAERLWFVSPDGFINLYEEGYEDDEADENDEITATAISDEMITRGYTFGTKSPKRMLDCEFLHSTWNPTFTVSARMDGVNEERTLKNAVTKSNSTYDKPWNATPYVTSNVNDDHDTPYRQDYHIALASGVTEITVGSGLNPETHQTAPERARVGMPGAYVQFRFQNTLGRQELIAVTAGATAGARREGTHI